MHFDRSINLKNIYYHYPNASRTALKNINLTIPARSTIGLVGATGSGKTTTVDIILSLLEPQKGSIEVDNIVINKFNSKAWQNFIGYVPQEIFLSDDTVAANIAFGVDPKRIDIEAVEHAAKIANLHDFVTSELPFKYQTTVGERGVRLSGGQRQRIMVARALSLEPKLLIADEPVSMVDASLRASILDTIEKLRDENGISVIYITHDLATAYKSADYVVVLHQGHVVEAGLPQSVICDPGPP